ncbi:ATP-binding protein [Streptomyces sp. NPDC046985]|uniref:ATP-binding protein n=1 Tax=Streptomyces sp. NPDC046985 TaxID=3155377 RepID=UPI0033C73859
MTTVRTPLEMELAALPKAVPEVRRAVRAHLGVPCPDVQLCVSELLANVIRHVGEGTPVSVRVDGTGDDRVRVAVSDREPDSRLAARRADAEEESGRGLLLIGSVALRWGVTRDARGKTVWCEVPLTGPRPAVE